MPSRRGSAKNLEQTSLTLSNFTRLIVAFTTPFWNCGLTTSISTAYKEHCEGVNWRLNSITYATCAQALEPATCPSGSSSVDRR
jgi:hypothetical protein